MKLMVKYAVKNNIDVIFVAGDIFHLYSPNERLLKILVWFIKLCYKYGVAVRFITGNHDTDGINYSVESLKNLSNMYSFDTEYPMLGFYPLIPNETAIYTEQIKGTNVVYVPWQNDMAGVLHDSKDFQKKNGTPSVLVTHCAVDGASTNSGYEMKRTKITKELLSGWDYVALGDFHKYQQVFDNCYYSGSIVKTVWDERHDKRSFNYVQIQKGIFNSVDVQIKRVNLPDDEFIELEMNYDTIDEYTKNVLVDVDGKKIEQSWIKVYVSGNIGIGEKLNLLKVHLMKCGASDVQIKIINNLISDGKKVTKSSDVKLNLDIRTACLEYMKQNKIYDENYKIYIEKKLTYEK